MLRIIPATHCTKASRPQDPQSGKRWYCKPLTREPNGSACSMFNWKGIAIPSTGFCCDRSVCEKTTTMKHPTRTCISKPLPRSKNSTTTCPQQIDWEMIWSSLPPLGWVVEWFHTIDDRAGGRTSKHTQAYNHCIKPGGSQIDPHLSARPHTLTGCATPRPLPPAGKQKNIYRSSHLFPAMIPIQQTYAIWLLLTSLLLGISAGHQAFH